MSVRVVVVDHRPTTRAVLRQLFESWGWDVVGEATDANEALAATRAHTPDLIVCDPSGGDPDLANLPALVEPLGAPAVVSIVDFPHELAATRGQAVLKGVPTEHLRRIFEEALAVRSATGEDVDDEDGGEVEAEVVVVGGPDIRPAAEDASEVPEVPASSGDAAADATGLSADVGEPPTEPAGAPGDAPRDAPRSAGAPDQDPVPDGAADISSSAGGGNEAVPSLSSDSVEMRRRAARALLQEPVTAERAARAGQAVTDPDREVRQLALHALEDNPRLAPMAALEAAAVDPDPGVRARALRLLGRAGHAAHASLLASHASADFEDALRRAAVAGLVDLLGRAASDFDQASLAAAVRAFGLVNAEVVEQVGPELGRAAQAVGLGRLEVFASDPRPEVSRGATRVLEAAGREPVAAEATVAAGPPASASVSASASAPSSAGASPRPLRNNVGPALSGPSLVPPAGPAAPAGAAAPADTGTGADTEPSTVEELLASAEPAMRIQGVRLAAETGALDGSLLARLMTDPLTEVRAAAIEALGGALGPAAALVLDSVVRSDTSVPVVLAAAAALSGAPPAARLQAAEAALAHPAQEVRLAGVDLVPADDDGSTVLIGLLADADFAVVRAAADALGRFPAAEVLVMIWPTLRTLERSTVELLIGKLVAADGGLTRRLARNASNSPDAVDRALGLRVLVALGAESVGNRLERALGDPDRHVRRTVAEALRDHPELVSVEVVGPRTHDPDVEVRRLTVEILAAAGDDRALTYLLEAARDPVAEVRAPARDHLLARCLTPSARMLVSALSAPNLRTVAAELLAHAPERTAELIAQAAADADPETRVAMSRVLSTPAAVEVLSASLASPDPDRRRVALRGLALARQATSAAAVASCLEDPEADIRRDASAILGLLGDPAAVPGLRRVLVGDPDMEVVAAAEAALRRLSEVEPQAPTSAPDVDLSDSGTREPSDTDAENR